MVQIAESPRTAERKREILRAASDVFRRRGLHDTGMRDIAGELGMAVGNLYYYFENKEALLAFCQEDALRGLLALAAEVRARPARADEKLHRLLIGHVVLLNEEIPGSLAHIEVEALSGRLRRAVMDKRRAYERVLQELLREGIEQGIFRPVDAKVASFALLGAVNWTVKWFRPDGGKSARQIANECAELLVRGLLRPGVEPRRPPEEEE